MKIKDHPKIKTLQWYLKFLSENLENMSELDLEKLVIESRYYFNTPNKGFDAYRSLAFSRARLLKEGKSIKKVASVETVRYLPSSYWEDWDSVDVFSQIRSSPNPFPPEYPWRKNLEIVQAELRDLLKKTMEQEEFTLGLAFAKTDFLFGRIEGRFKVLYDVEKPNYGDLINDVSTLVQQAKLSFMFALDNIPDQGAIKTCRECGKYFLHLSKKPKFFCDYRCTVKFTSRRRRKKDPEGYRAAQREIMRKKYRKERAKKLGRPVEKIRFQRKSISKPDKRKEG